MTNLEACDDKRSIFFLQTFIGILEVHIEFQLRRAARQNIPEGSLDLIMASYRQLEELERVFEERCGKSFSKVRVKRGGILAHMLCLDVKSSEVLCQLKLF